MAELTARPPLVMKFGGSAFTELKGFTRVARYAARRRADGERPLIVVVSAMSGTTGRLRRLLDSLAPDPPADAAAMLLTSGETVSVALLAAALDAEGVAARPLSAAETGLLADRLSDRAHLHRADPGPLRSALYGSDGDGCRVVVVPGGQAADPAGRTVMLGRNSSDLSAVALAGALDAAVCELYSDVPGVCTADPYLVPGARTLDRIGYAGLRRMSRHGAKVVHDSAVDWAERTGVRLHCRPFPWAAAQGGGTLVGPGGPSAAAVIVHQTDEVWRFRTPSERSRAADALHTRDVRTTAVDTRSGAYLVTPREPGAPQGPLAAARLHDDLCLITALGEDGAADHLLVRRTDAEREARRCHDVLHPPGSRPSTGTPPGPKSRSPHSSVLVADPAASPLPPDA
ncbi:hypothetical protein QCN29_01235 [Streptomyces sp. HNM0663]|uniref:aspartate kinase n=1 Tax=Streptomyces chengmaiensis TaxID=3040919 RepID=A0ABT6HGL5_9ACTN|nr:hypothetical protein [Streptomyces chengmaiensis]MDH2387430.1 hypothetical protein [Streptomyces chengmaiensis]